MIEGQDKVFKDVIEPLENVSVTLIPTVKQDIRDFGPPNEVSLFCAFNSLTTFCFVYFLKFCSYWSLIRLLLFIIKRSQVAETLIKRVLAPSSQKTKLIEAVEV